MIMHEDLLRHIWSRQMFDTTHLLTTDGLTIRIIDPGRLSRQSGPDFREARIEIDGTVYSGDIEFHRNSEDWELHHHQHDQNYNSVILHVVLQGASKQTQSESGRIIPTIILEPFLHSSIASIGDHLSREEYHSRRRRLLCEAENSHVPPELINSWIKILYRERLQEKMKRMQDRLQVIIIQLQRTVGEPNIPYDPGSEEIPIPFAAIEQEEYKRQSAWEQLLYEEILDCLGYSNNRIPMKKLAEHVPLSLLLSIQSASQNQDQTNPPLSRSQIEALLFKASGLLPSIDHVMETDSKVYLHALNVSWKELHTKSPIPFIHHTEWNFSPTRPANFPTIRIAAASVTVFNILHRSLLRSIITVIEGRYSSVQSKIGQLSALLDAGDHPFWSFHYSFSEPTGKKHSLLGKARINDILVNTVIPFAYLYSRVFGNDLLAEQCLNIAVELPLLEDNSVLQIMNTQLLKNKVALTAAFQQQGLLQLYKHYCLAGRCSECRIGNEVMNR